MQSQLKESELREGKAENKNVKDIGSVRGSPNGTIGNLTNGIIGTISITIGTNGITNGTISKILNDIGIPLVPLGKPRTHA